MLEAVFWLFAAITVASGFLVISAKNPVHSVLWLILAFFSSAGLFVLMGAEFLAMLLVIVYVGAVAVLFLFVVMMLDINFTELRKGALQHLTIGGLVGLVLLVELVTLVVTNHFGELDFVAAQALVKPTGVDNTESLGLLIYTDFAFIFQMAGLILLVAMIGAIVLTHRSRPGVKRQNIMRQNAVKPEDAYETVKISSGEGVAPVNISTKKG